MPDTGAPITAQHAHGTTLSHSETGTTYTKVPGLVTITPPQVTADEIEVTDHDSNGWKEFIQGLKDGGSMPVKLNFKESNKADVKKFLALVESGKVIYWKIELPAGVTLTILLQGFVKAFNLDELVSGSAVTLSGEIRNSGQPTFTFAD